MENRDISEMTTDEEEMRDDQYINEAMQKAILLSLAERNSARPRAKVRKKRHAPCSSTTIYSDSDMETEPQPGCSKDPSCSRQPEYSRKPRRVKPGYKEKPPRRKELNAYLPWEYQSQIEEAIYHSQLEAMTLSSASVNSTSSTLLPKTSSASSSSTFLGGASSSLWQGPSLASSSSTLPGEVVDGNNWTRPIAPCLRRTSPPRGLFESPPSTPRSDREYILPTESDGTLPANFFESPVQSRPATAESMRSDMTEETDEDAPSSSTGRPTRKVKKKGRLKQYWEDDSYYFE